MATADNWRPDLSRTSTETTATEYNPAADASEVQRGRYTKPGFYSDVSSSKGFANFATGIATASQFASSLVTLKSSFAPNENERGTTFRLTEREYYELQKKAESISNFSGVPFDVCEDFLLILCYVDDIKDMIKIADAVQVSELANPKILRKPMSILSIQRLEKIAFAASALEGLINLYRKYIITANSMENKSDNEDINSILDTIGALSSGLGGLLGGSSSAKLNNGDSEDAIGNFLSELVTGSRIPMNVIAKNPILQAPSYCGKAFFGESPNPLSNVDIDQLFAKKIGAFPKPSNGAGTSSFSFQNMGTFNGSMPLTSVVSKILTGSSSFTSGSKKARQIDSVVSSINSITGASANESVEMRRADNAIPIISALATTYSGFGKSVFSQSTFQNAWSLSNGVSNHLLNNDPTFIETMRRFL